MSNTNLEDVIVQLTETRNELSEEDLRLWDGLENERVSRIAGDDANKSLTLQVQDSVSGTERRLSTEVIHREQGDLDKLGLLNQLSQSMSAYRIKTDKEIEAERFARDILGINLDARITTAEASFNHKELKLYQDIQEVFTDLDGKYTSMDARIKKYEELLQDITMDSIKITMDNGEINMGAWTILSQAREWDLEILAKMRGFQEKTTEDVNQALEELQNQLPITENIINEMMENLSDSPLISELRDALNEGIDTTESLAVRLAKEEAARAQAMIDLAYANAQVLAAEKAALAESLAAEAQARADEVQEEADRRIESIRQIRADLAQDVGELNDHVDSIREGAAADKAGILETVNNYKTELKSDIATVNTELLGALDGVNTLVTEVRDENGVTLNELTTYKASNDVAVAGLLSKVTTNISDTAANASKITGLTSQLATTNTELGTVRNTSANALSKANTAVTANSALSTRVDALAAAITDLGEGAETSVDVYAFNALKAEVQTNAAGVTSLVEQVDALGTSYTNLTDGVEANTDAVSTLTVKQSEMNGDISQLSSDVTYLTSELGITNTALNTKASNQALSNLSTKLTTTDGKVAANTQQLTQLNTDLTTVKNGLETKASTEALNDLATEVVELEGGLAVNASAITSLKSEIDTELDKKATVTAVNGLTTKVNEVEGKTTTNANNLLALNTSVGNVVKGLANKLDASTISDYYTKSQADDKAAEVAAGKVEEFSASISNEHLQELLVDGNKPAYSNGSLYQVAGFTMKEAREVGSTYTLRFKITINRDGNDTTSYIRAYQGGNAALIRNYTEADSTIFEVTFTASAFSPANEIRFYHFPNNPSAKEGTSVTVHWASLVKAEDDAKAQTQAALTANSTAIQNTSAEVARVDGRVTATNSAQTLLEGRVQTVEGGISKKADASALSSLDTRVGTVEGQYTTQASDITRLNNSLDTTNVNVGTAQTAAQNAMNAAGAKGKVIFGNTAPVVADRLVQNLWIDTTSNANTPKRWNGSAWVVVTDKVATDAAKAVKDLDTAVKTKADVSALNSLTTKVTDEAKKTTANTSSITELNSDIVKINNDLATKANASALSDMYTKNEVDDKAAEIAAGEVSKYNASLVIGAGNYWQLRNYGSSDYGTRTVEAISSDLQHQKVTITGVSAGMFSNLWQGLREEGYPVDTDQPVSFAAMIKSPLPFIRLYMYAWGQSNPTANKLVRVVPNEWTRITDENLLPRSSGNSSNYGGLVGIRLLAEDNSINANDLIGLSFEIKEVVLQSGTKAGAYVKPTALLEKSVNANATAIETTNAEVIRVDDRVTTESNRITTLAGRVDTAENGLALKADAAALNDIYTKTETDAKATSLAAGEISKYDANLVIGGSNLQDNADFKTTSLNRWTGIYGDVTSIEGGIQYKGTTVNSVARLHKTLVGVEVGQTYTLSVWAKSPVPLAFSAPVDATEVSKTSPVVHNPAVFQRYTYTFTPRVVTGVILRAYISNIALTGVVIINKEKLEIGSKGTDWSPSSSDIQSSLDANATAISSTNAEVERVDERVTATSEDITGLKNRMTTAEGSKADVSAVNALTARVGDVEGGLSTQASNTTALEAKIDSKNGASLVPDYYMANHNDWESHYGYNLANQFTTTAQGNIGPNIFFKRNSPTPDPNNNWNYSKTRLPNNKKYRLSMLVRGSAGAVGSHHFTGRTFDAQGNIISYLNTTVTGQAPATGAWRLVTAVIDWTTNPAKTIAFGFAVGHTGDSSKGWWMVQGFSVKEVITEDDIDDTLATAKALSTTNAEVSRVNDVVKGHVNDIRDLTTNIAGKADSSALNALTVRVADEERKSSTQATSIVSLTSSLTSLEQDNLVSPFKDKTNTGSAYLQGSCPLKDNYIMRTGEVYTVRGKVSFVHPNTLSASQGLGVYLEGAARFTSIDLIKQGDDQYFEGTVTVASSLDGRSFSNLNFYLLPSGTAVAGTKTTVHWAELRKGDQSSKVDLSGYATASALNTLDTKVEDIDGVVSTQASQILTLTSDNTNNKNALQVQARVIDGVKANYMVKMETNGVIGGFGLMQSTGVLGQVVTSFGVNANSFFIGAPASKKQPFIVTTSNQEVNGVTYPAGTYIDVAMIANATIGTAHIANASITNAKIASIDAAKITTGTLDAKRIRVGSTSQFDTGYAPTDVLNGAKAYTDALEIGGRNLAINTGTGVWVTYGSGVTITSSTGSDGNTITKVVQTSTVTGGIQQAVSDRTMALETNDKYIISFDVRSNIASSSALLNYVYIMHAVGGNQSVNIREVALSSTSFTRVTASFTKTGTSPTSYVMISSSSNTVNDWFEIKNVKVEKGNKATDWTPAPEDVDTAIESKAKTFTAQPAPPYTSGDLWRNGATIRVCTVTRASGSYVAADWTLVGDVTSANTAANSNQLGGKASATVLSDITGAKNAADAAALKANAADNQLALWKYPNSTEIDGGKIRTNSITANKLDVTELSAVSTVLGRMVSYVDPTHANRDRRARSVITGTSIEMYDDNNILRVEIGVYK